MEPNEAWFVYDGECPLCQIGARYTKLRKEIALHLVDARTQAQHPVMQEIKALDIDLDQGMALKFGGNFYHGADALHMLAMLSSDVDWRNRLNARLFRHKTLARLCYPFMKAGRSLALAVKNVPAIENLKKKEL